MARELGQPDHAVAGAVLLELSVGASATMLFARRRGDRAVVACYLGVALPVVGVGLRHAQAR